MFTAKLEIACTYCGTVVLVHVHPFDAGAAISLGAPGFHGCKDDGDYQLMIKGAAEAVKLETKKERVW